MSRSMFMMMALVAGLGGCRGDQPADTGDAGTAEENLLANGEFGTARKSSSPAYPQAIDPWFTDSLHAELRADAGFNGKPGYLRITGGMGDAGYVMQMLQRPLAEGTTYTVTVTMRFRPQDSPGLDHGNVRLLATGATATGPGTSDAALAATQVRSSSWQRYTLGPWRAKTKYERFGIIIDNEIPGGGGSITRSVVDIDDVRLVETK